jgi:hypothetical protein
MSAKQGHEPFSWLSDDAQRIPGTRFVERARDTAAGIAMILELVERSEIEEARRETPHLGAWDRSGLMRFAIASARSLRDLAEEHQDWLNEHGVEAFTRFEGKKGGES